MARAPFVAVDTEFVRDRTYYGRLCVVQLATEDELALVDALEPASLAPLRDLLVDRDVLKVIHAGRQDFQLFHDAWSAVPRPVFDTQLAATVLGHGEQAGFAALVEEVLGIRLAKSETLTDWSQRPLAPEQLAYAADDVVQLVPLYRQLRERLVSAGREGWLHDEHEALADADAYRLEVGECWRSVKGANRLRPRELAVLRELAAWREERARERDRPRRWVLADDVLVELARRAPPDAAGLGRLRGKAADQVGRHAREILEAIGRGAGSPEAEWPRPPRGRRPSREDLALADLMAVLVRLRADEADVASTVVANRAQLEQVAARGAEADAPVLRGWRRALVGEELLALRDGRLRLRVEEGRVTVDPS